jgi:hypothetical protein
MGVHQESSKARTSILFGTPNLPDRRPNCRKAAKKALKWQHAALADGAA